jgi:hypothetical protein
MILGLRGTASFVVASSLVLGSGAWSLADDAEPIHQLSLADLAKYRAALKGKATANDAQVSDPPAHVSFKDLWNRPGALRGRRVMIEGRVQRIFRQRSVGSFPALAEIWIASPAGDPFCLVIPQENDTGTSPVNQHDPDSHRTTQRVPKLGQTVRFTGTFLKMIRYASGDGDRLAPLVVGDQPPVPVRETRKASRAGSFSANNVVGRWTESPASWLLALTLGLLAAGVLAWWHLDVPSRGAGLRRRHRITNVSLAADPPLEFIERRDEPCRAPLINPPPL